MLIDRRTGVYSVNRGNRSFRLCSFQFGLDIAAISLVQERFDFLLRVNRRLLGMIQNSVGDVGHHVGRIGADRDNGIGQLWGAKRETMLFESSRAKLPEGARPVCCFHTIEPTTAIMVEAAVIVAVQICLRTLFGRVRKSFWAASVSLAKLTAETGQSMRLGRWADRNSRHTSTATLWTACTIAGDGGVLTTADGHARNGGFQRGLRRLDFFCWLPRVGCVLRLFGRRCSVVGKEKNFA